MQMGKQLKFILQSVLLGLAIAFIIILIKPDLLPGDRNTGSGNNQKNTASSKPSPVMMYSYAAAVKAAAPAVVNIYSAKQSMPLVYRYIDPRFNTILPPEQTQSKPKYKLKSLGSGVIFDNKGYILTNNHLVKGADKIQVLLYDGRTATAKLIGSDPGTDIAVLKIDLPNLPSIKFGSSEKLLVGDVVLAIGNPYGVGQTVTQGIISAKGRNRLGLTTYENFLQTDAAINPGNSGGALINPKGELIGISTAIYSKSGGSQGIGFAIPVNDAKQVMNSILKHGYVMRGWLGVGVMNVNQRARDSFSLKPDSNGVLITQIISHGPGQIAGLVPYDIIVQINDTKIFDSKHFTNFVAQLEPGTEVDIYILREGKGYKTKASVTMQPAFNFIRR